jgi:hypothetical protein
VTTILRRQLTVTALAVTLGVGESGCGAAASQATSDGGIFVAFGSDFAAFRSWPSRSVDNTIAQGATHVAGTREIYINQLPPAGAASFPVGTMIVKITEADGQIFARAKRGGGYNPSGALDWEWFELLEGAGGVSIMWHGVGPPAGEKYAGDATSGCNPCHGAARSNDYVLSPWLQLGGSDDAGTSQTDLAITDAGTSPDGGGTPDGDATGESTGG